MTEGFDVGLEMSGNQAAFRDMLANMSHGAKIAMLGIPEGDMAIDWRTVIFNMLTIKGIYGREMYETWYKMSVMLQSGLDISAGHHASLPLHGVREGLRSDVQRPIRQSDSELAVARGAGVARLRCRLQTRSVAAATSASKSRPCCPPDRQTRRSCPWESPRRHQRLAAQFLRLVERSLQIVHHAHRSA
jgi:hypothetical protein